MEQIKRIKTSAYSGGFSLRMVGTETLQNLFIYPSGKFIYKSYTEIGNESKNTKTKYYQADHRRVIKLMYDDFKAVNPLYVVMDGGVDEIEINTSNTQIKFNIDTPVNFSPLLKCEEEIKRLTENYDLWLFSN